MMMNELHPWDSWVLSTVTIGTLKNSILSIEDKIVFVMFDNPSIELE
jgi:hypothetical protein